MTTELHTLRSRLALRAFAMTFLALVVAGLAGGLVADRISSGNEEDSAREYLSTLVSEMEIADNPTDPNVRAPIEQAGASRLAQIIDEDNISIVVATANATNAPVIDAASIGPITSVERVDDPDVVGSPLVIAARDVAIGGVTYGVIAGVRPTPPLLGVNARTLAAFIASVVIAAGVAIGVFISVRSALRPVGEVALEAEQKAMTRSWEDWHLETEATTDEIQRLIGRLNVLLSRIHDTQDREREFLENASHDLRTPIAVARAELDLANSTSNDPDIRSALGSAIEELDRLDRLTADLLILAKMRSEPPHAAELVHLGHLARNTAARMIRDPDARDVAVHVEGRASVAGDPLTLERAVANIFSNAMKFAAEKIDIEVDESVLAASIRVLDDGPGFAPSMLSDATQRFARGTERGDGTGLGLAIASAIAEAHGGALEVGNRLQGGAEVTLRLPTAQASSQPDRTSAPGPTL